MLICSMIIVICGMIQNITMSPAENVSTCIKIFLHYQVYMLSVEMIAHLFFFFEKGKFKHVQIAIKKEKIVNAFSKLDSREIPCEVFPLKKETFFVSKYGELATLVHLKILFLIWLPRDVTRVITNKFNRFLEL